jgi:hypothetical protein
MITAYTICAVCRLLGQFLPAGYLQTSNAAGRLRQALHSLLPLLQPFNGS